MLPPLDGTACLITQSTKYLTPQFTEDTEQSILVKKRMEFVTTQAIFLSADYADFAENSKPEFWF
jgi:hypothetical protein